MKFFEFSNFGIFGFSIFRKISIEILRKNDFQNFRFFDFSKNFQLRRFFSTKNFASFPLIFFLKWSSFIWKRLKVEQEIARTQRRRVREQNVWVCFAGFHPNHIYLAQLNFYHFKTSLYSNMPTAFLVMPDRSRRPGEASTASGRPQQPPDKISKYFTMIFLDHKKQN